MESLSDDIILQILIFVVASSLQDLCRMKLTCKKLNDLGDDEHVLHHASLKSIPIIPWNNSEGRTRFLQRCRKSNNPEALFRLGMVEYFANSSHQLACESFERAARLGHEEATYILGIILLCENGESMLRGIELLKDVETRKMLKNAKLSESRKICQTIMFKLWPNPIVHEKNPICLDSTCKKTKARPSSGWWEDEFNFDCELCKWDHELNMFFKDIPWVTNVFN